MRGKNPVRPPAQGAGETLDVQEIFATLQGEGPHAGTPAVFVRLGGCNLACDFCDTQFESFAPMAVDAITVRVTSLANGAEGTRTRSLVVLTGGEPLRQPVERLCAALIREGFRVQMETNGTLYRPIPEEVEIVCSPKNTGSGYRPLRQDLAARANAIKFLVSAHDPLYRDVAEIGQSAYAIPVYVQPMDEYAETKNAANLERTKELAAQHGYRLSLQLHKILGIP